MEKWYVAAKRADFNAWARRFGISPVVARILRNRDLTQEDDVERFLHGTLADCHSPWLLKDMDKAVEHILKAIGEGIPIRVIGDYDVDGICSSYILTRGLQILGARADTAIPHRIHDGYGLNDHLIEAARADGIGMIVTCDNGIAASPQIALAHSYGIQVIVTDHHEVPFVVEEEMGDDASEEALEGSGSDRTESGVLEGNQPENGEAEGGASEGGRPESDRTESGMLEGNQPEDGGPEGDASEGSGAEESGFRRRESNGDRTEDGRVCKRRELLPSALAVIDPKQEQCRYPFPGICGGVVAYKLIAALAERTGSEALTEAMEEFLEFAALSTVCDVMELKGENRILVKEGLKRLRHTRNQGLAALVEVNGIEPEKLSAYHLGFVIGPCLNATGRLDTARRALELLQSASKVEAMSAARELKELNDSRKNLTLQGVEQAERYIGEHHMEQDKVMVIYLPEVHESLAGIIAGRVREKYHHPVFILTKGEEGVKGSGRSVEGYHMYEAMTQVKGYFTKFGGHAMAAGLSMREEDIDGLRRDLNQSCRLGPEDFIPRVHIDVPMPLDYADDRLAEELELLEPFGVGNPKPLFAQKNLCFLAGYKMGANRTCARYRVRTETGAERQVVFFGDLEKFGAFLEAKCGAGSEAALYGGRGSFPVSVVYQLGKNTYRGKTELQYVMQYYS